MTGGVCAVMLVRDEEDIIEATLRHLLAQVDHIVVCDNLSTDRTRSIVEGLQEERAEADHGAELELRTDDDPAYWQSAKTTALAVEAFHRGFGWVIPCDADEIWYAPDERKLRDYLGGVGRDVQIVTADLFNHFPTLEDNVKDPDPVRRIGFRQRAHMALPKVCARCRPDLVIHPGNHGASTSGTALAVPGLVVRHFSHRSPEQYLRKIRNGQAAYALTDLPEEIGGHWRMFERATDDAIRDHFYRWFHLAVPRADISMMYDPAPHSRWPQGG